jgi:NAD(P)-dependent dehydrogenase (short-subunit alcohol dehydrogenase family)
MSTESPFPSFTKLWYNKPSPEIDPARPELSAAGKFIVVTGGGVSIGLAVAAAYAKAGARTVAILGRRLEVLKTAASQIAAANPNGTTNVLFESADVSIPESVGAALKAFSSKTGAKIDILVSNAGILPQPTTVLNSKASEIQEGLEINILGPLHLIQAAQPYASSNLCLINVSSGIGHMQAIPGDTWAYAATKLAVVKMLDYLQFENPNWHVVNVHPGVVASAMNTKHGAIPPMDEGERIKQGRLLCPPADFILAELPGHFMVWVASDEAKFLRNRYAWVNWDVKELKARAQEIASSSLLKIKIGGVEI